jgi:excisionase family DNA binding protein
MPTNAQQVSRLALSTSQAARELGVSLGTVRRWADMGYLQAYRTPGGQRRFSAAQIEEFVSSLEQRGHNGGRLAS